MVCVFLFCFSFFFLCRYTLFLCVYTLPLCVLILFLCIYTLPLCLLVLLFCHVVLFPRAYVLFFFLLVSASTAKLNQDLIKSWEKRVQMQLQKRGFKGVEPWLKRGNSPMRN